MKKRILLFSVLLTLACNSSDDEVVIMDNLYFNHQPLELKGQVQFLKETVFSAKNVLDSLSGKLAKEASFEAYKGAITQSISLDFDKLGNKTNMFLYASNGRMRGKKSLRYGENQNLLEEIEQRPSGRVVERILYDYNTNNQLIHKTSYAGKDTLHYRETFTYNAKGQETELKQFNSKDKLYSISKHTYIDQGKIKETRAYTSEEKLLCVFKYKYDDNGYEIVSESDCPTTSMYMKWECQYNTKGQEIEICSLDKSGNPKNLIVIQYDEQRNAVERKILHPDGSLSLLLNWQHIYDDQGNWTKKVRLENEVPSEIIERELVYYE